MQQDPLHSSLPADATPVEAAGVGQFLVLSPPDVPAGHVAVCVGRMARRFVVRVSHLNHPVLRQLLHRAEEEYGFPSGRTGPVSLPCVDEALFEHLLCHISSSRFRDCSLEDFEIVFSFTGGELCQFAGDSRPLLQGHRHAEKTVC